MDLPSQALLDHELRLWVDAGVTTAKTPFPDRAWPLAVKIYPSVFLSAENDLQRCPVRPRGGLAVPKYQEDEWGLGAPQAFSHRRSTATHNRGATRRAFVRLTLDCFRKSCSAGRI